MYNQLSGVSVDAYIKQIVNALADGVSSSDDLIDRLKSYDAEQQASRLEQSLALVGQVRPIRSQDHIDLINSALAAVKGV